MRPANLLFAFLRLFRRYSPEEKRLSVAVQRITGVKPFNLELYRLAMRHTSVALTNRRGFKESNERLEYLGDAVLGTVVAEYLFQRYPFKEEGFLTEIRSRIVNRESLNQLAKTIGLSELVEYDLRRKTSHSHKSMYGDAMEAFIGALYLDKGFKFCRRFIIRKLLMRHYDLDEIIDTTTNFKSKIIEWTQKNGKKIDFIFVSEKRRRNQKEFKTVLIIEDEEISQGYGLSKKKAEQDAARKACEKLNVE